MTKLTVELLQTLSTAQFIGAAALLLAAIAMFFLFNIPKIFGETTGSTARKAIENIRRQNEETGNKAYRPSAVNAARGKVTDKITPSGRLVKKNSSLNVAVGTARLITAELYQQTSDAENYSNAETVPIAAFDEAAEKDEDIFDGSDQVFNDWNADGFSVETDISYTQSCEIIE